MCLVKNNRRSDVGQKRVGFRDNLPYLKLTQRQPDYPYKISAVLKCVANTLTYRRQRTVETS